MIIEDGGRGPPALEKKGKIMDNDQLLQKTSYYVRADEAYICTVGDRAERHSVGAEGSGEPRIWGEDFGSLEEARAKYWELVEEHTGAYRVTRTRSGCDSIEFVEVEIEKQFLEEDGEDRWLFVDGETVEFWESLPKEVERAWNRQLHAYCRFLDYNDMGYGYLADYLGYDEKGNAAVCWEGRFYRLVGEPETVNGCDSRRPPYREVRQRARLIGGNPKLTYAVFWEIADNAEEPYDWNVIDRVEECD